MRAFGNNHYLLRSTLPLHCLLKEKRKKERKKKKKRKKEKKHCLSTKESSADYKLVRDRTALHLV